MYLVLGIRYSVSPALATNSADQWEECGQPDQGLGREELLTLVQLLLVYEVPSIRTSYL